MGVRDLIKMIKYSKIRLWRQLYNSVGSLKLTELYILMTFTMYNLYLNNTVKKGGGLCSRFPTGIYIKLPLVNAGECNK